MNFSKNAKLYYWKRHYVEDHYKRRLTHSLEVSGIATSLARQLKINEVATEAIALGHDVGHTPFGHAGEEAINAISMEYFKDKKSYTENIPLRGFNHCFQAIEVVTRIEKHKLDSGLNLTFDIRDGILKHICNRDDMNILKYRPYFSLANICSCTRYKEYEKTNYSSLEAQCVWFADKLCYLFGDLEDGLRAGIFDYADLVKHEFIEYLRDEYGNYLNRLSKKIRDEMNQEFIDILTTRQKYIDIMDKFYYVRNKAITLSLDDCEREVNRKIEEKNIGNINNVFKSQERIVNVNSEWQEKWMQFYRKFMVDKLFEDVRVKDSNYRAGEIIKKLFNCYINANNLIPREFRENMRRAYEGLVESEHINFITTRNYVAGMTDSFALQQYEKLFYSGKTFPFLTPTTRSHPKTFRKRMMTQPS